MLNTLFLSLLGLAMSYGDKKNKRFYIGLFILSALIRIVIGGRGAFGAIMLVLLWMYCQNKKVSLKKISMYILEAGAILLFVASLSIRFAEIDESITPLDTVKFFLFDNGISLMVFDASRLIDDYPWQPYFQNFIPGFVRIVDLITGQSSLHNATFASSLAYQLNPVLYYNGNGLGWTLMSDIYLYSAGNVIVFGILMAFFTYGLGMISDNMRNNGLVKTVAYCIATSLLLLPRDGLNSVVPLIYYSMFIWWTLKSLNTSSRKKSTGHFYS